MDALKFIKEFYRMCDYYSGGFCKGCPRKEEPSCDSSTMSDEELAKLISDVEKWSKEHPQRTRLQDLLEKYPNAMMCNDDSPKVCCKHLGYIMSCPENKNCKECWNMPVEDE